MAAPEWLAVPPEEAIRRFRAKGYHVGFDWRDTDAAHHLRSFTVAKAMRLDILHDIREAVDAAIAEGATFREFRARLEPTLVRKGWWGRREVLDPVTGETRLVQLGSPRRLRIIFDTNLRMAGARGRWERIERTKSSLPYLRYVAVQDARTRPEHMRWHNTVLPVDHEFWRTHAPPNGWRCRCQVVALSERDLERSGLSVSPDPVVASRDWTNRRTGDTTRVPEGIDPGFAHNPGLLDPGVEGQAFLEAAATSMGMPDAASGASRWMAAGREARRRIDAEAGGDPLDPGYPVRFRAALKRRLRGERGAGTVAPDLMEPPDGSPDALAVASVAAAARELPASWVRAGNGRGAIRVFRMEQGRGGSYDRAARVIETDGTSSNSLHEYVHHLQQAMPDVQAAVAAEHRRRTTRLDGTRMPAGLMREYLDDPYVRGRDDDYALAYAGRDYLEPDGDALEVWTTHLQALLHDLWGEEQLPDMLRRDPAMLDMMLGLLLGYDP